MEQENAEVKKEVTFQTESANKKLDEAYKNKQISKDDYKKRKKELDDFDKSKNVSIDNAPSTKEKK